MDSRRHSILLVGGLPDLDAVFDELPCDLVLTENLDDALARLRQDLPDLVLCDFPSLEPIRDVNQQVRIIVLAQEAPPHKVLAAIDEQAYAYYGPPFDPLQIRESMLEALERPDLADGIQLESREPKFISLRLRCRLETADRLMRFVTQMRTDICQEERNQIASAFREMLLNAIEHGGRFNPNAWVRVSRVRTERTVVYFIQDPGPGFNRRHLEHAAVSNPDDNPAQHMLVRMEKGLRAGGFGMLISKELVDEVIYNERGNEVLLIKHLDRFQPFCPEDAKSS